MNCSPALLISLAVIATPALAQSPWYGGVSAGQSKTDGELVVNRESTVVNATVSGSSFDSKASGFKVFGGYQFTPHIGVELNYADLGRSRLVTGILTTGSPQQAGSVTLERQIEGFGADLVLRAPIGPRASIFGRVGAVRSRLEASALLNGAIEFTNAPGERSRLVTASETLTRYGVGAEWGFGRGMGFRVEWERWLDVGKAFEIGGSGTTGEADTDFYSVGFVYRF